MHDDVSDVSDFFHDSIHGNDDAHVCGDQFRWKSAQMKDGQQYYTTLPGLKHYSRIRQILKEETQKFFSSD